MPEKNIRRARRTMREIVAKLKNVGFLPEEVDFKMRQDGKKTRIIFHKRLFRALKKHARRSEAFYLQYFTFEDPDSILVASDFIGNISFLVSRVCDEIRRKCKRVLKALQVRLINKVSNFLRAKIFSFYRGKLLHVIVSRGRKRKKMRLEFQCPILEWKKIPRMLSEILNPCYQSA